MRYRSVFISDLHLGTSSCKHEQLLSFLRQLRKNPPDSLYLVGDILDLWKLGTGGTWSDADNNVLRSILDLSRRGIRVYYITGNHDDVLRKLPQYFMFNEIPLCDLTTFISKDGRRFLIIHGDQYDKFINNHRLLGIIGSFFYDATTYMNKVLFYIQNKLGRPHWSLSQYLKQKAKAFTHVIDVFEHSMCDSIKAEGYNGVICGHIHMPKILEQDQFQYMNCGDWTENCSAIVEHHDGTFHILYYKEQS